MKFVTILLTGLLLSPVFSFGTKDKTISNLTAAYRGELAALTQYTAFADKATKEGYPEIALMFTAIAKAESIHAGNHKRVLALYGVEVQPYKPEITVSTTAENLKEAAAEENHDFSVLYPGFIRTAQYEDAKEAVESLTWAMMTEAKHNQIFNAALITMQSKHLENLSKVYYVCAKCGNTFDTPTPDQHCPFCDATKDQYFRFPKK